MWSVAATATGAVELSTRWQQTFFFGPLSKPDGGELFISRGAATADRFISLVIYLCVLVLSHCSSHRLAAAAFPANASQFANQSGQVSPTSGGTMATAQGYNATQGGQLYQGSCPVPLSQFPAPTPRCYNPKTHGQTIAVAGAGGARKGTRASDRQAAKERQTN